ncbi:MAG: SGNH/GDSL hydrolase family protein, partial [Phycisphaerae bacterium]
PLGYGYVFMVASMIEARYPQRELRFENRGIGGNTVLDLQARWAGDAIAERPDWLSCLIGINDATRVWRRSPGHAQLTASCYRQNYRQLLQQISEQTGARLILWEPFLITADQSLSRFRELQAYIEVVHELAEQFQAILIGAQSLFVEACQKRSPEFWAHDGVHPSKPGHALMAQAFLDRVGW